MLYYVVKLLITSVVIVVISELGKRSSLLAAVLASIPLVSVLAMIWLYVDTRSTEKVAALAGSIFWLVIPSLILFITLPALLRSGFSFFASLTLSTALTVAGYVLMLFCLRKLGIAL